MIAQTLSVILALHRGARRQMHQSYGRCGAIYMLSTRATRTNGVFTTLGQQGVIGQMVAHSEFVAGLGANQVNDAGKQHADTRTDAFDATGD